jgi:hypothetical protein
MKIAQETRPIVYELPMPHPEELNYWTAEVSSRLLQLSKPQALVLAYYSYGMAMTGCCGQSVVAEFLGLLLDIPWPNLRQRLREWNYESAQKRGKKRKSIDVRALFAPFLAWVLSHFKDRECLVLAVDVTYLRDRLTILVVSVVYRGCAIPVAWKVLLGEEKGEWHPIWVELLHSLRSAVPLSCETLVLFDRGLYSKRLFQEVCALGWHPFMRIRTQGLYCAPRNGKWKPLDKLAFRGMKSKILGVKCFKGDPLTCTLLVQWAEKYDEPCLVATDFSPKELRKLGNPYALRAWIESGFKDLKRGGLRWEQCKTSDPQRMERLMFVQALALFWLIRTGTDQANELLNAKIPASRLSVVTLGRISALVQAIRNQPLNSVFFPPYSFPPAPS